MSMTVPGSLPQFVDGEFYSSNADSALTARRLLQWANYVFYKHLPCTPFDPAAYSLNTFELTAPQAEGGFHGFIGANGLEGGVYRPTSFGSFMVPPPHGRHTHMVVRCSIVATGSVGYIRLTSARGSITDIPFNNLNGWTSTRIPASAGDVFTIQGFVTTKGTDFPVMDCFHARWEETTSGVWVPYTQNHYLPSGMPDTPHALRWYAAMANYFAATKAPIIANKFYGFWRNEYGDYAIGRYVMHVSPRVSQLKMRFLMRSTAGSPVLSVTSGAMDGSYTLFTNFDVSVTDGTYRWHEATVNITPSNTSREVQLYLFMPNYGGGARLRLATVEVWEEAIDLPTANGEGQPGWTSVDDGAIGMGTSIGYDARQALVRNMYGCWQLRGRRSLVSDCRWDINEVDSANTDPLRVNAGTSSTDFMSVYWPGPFSPSRVRLGYANRYSADEVFSLSMGAHSNGQFPLPPYPSAISIKNPDIPDSARAGSAPADHIPMVIDVGRAGFGAAPEMVTTNIVGWNTVWRHTIVRSQGLSQYGAYTP